MHFRENKKRTCSHSLKNLNGDLNVAFLRQLSHTIQLHHKSIAADTHISFQQYPKKKNDLWKQTLMRRRESYRRWRRWSWDAGVKEVTVFSNWWRSPKVFSIELITWLRFSFESSVAVPSLVWYLIVPLLPLPQIVPLVFCTGSITSWHKHPYNW